MNSTAGAILRRSSSPRYSSRNCGTVSGWYDEFRRAPEPEQRNPARIRDKNNRNSELIASRPSHVPPHLVRDFDLYHMPGGDTDVQAAHLEIQRTLPAIFWTPHHGGHWPVTGGEDILAIWRDTRHFSGLLGAPRDD